MNAHYTSEELNQAIKSFKSSISKCEKAKLKLKEGSPQRKWIDKQLEAFYIAVSLIDELDDKEPSYMGQYAKPEWGNAIKTFESLTSKCENILAKFRDGSPQQTLTLRRLKAFNMAITLIRKEMENIT